MSRLGEVIEASGWALFWTAVIVCALVWHIHDVDVKERKWSACIAVHQVDECKKGL